MKKIDYYKESLKLHRRLRGKIEIKAKIKIRSKTDLSLAYTPGVAAASKEISLEKEKVFEYTNRGNTVAVVSDGTAVLGLGDIGPEAALPVMEGKCLLFKEFANIDAFPIVLDTKDPEKIIQTVTHIAPSFAGINLEDISAPRCFDIEEKLQNIGIPVFHDDQHGTAIVVLAALINATKVVGKSIFSLKVVISGAGAAGSAIAYLLSCLEAGGKVLPPSICTGVKEIIMVDRAGTIYAGRENLEPPKKKLAAFTNKNKLKGDLRDAIIGADVFIGVSSGNLLEPQMIKMMAARPIIFAMANPVPEIMPETALKAGAKVVATGRSDFPNQVNNVLAFPGVFRGALDAKVTRIDTNMKLAAAYALSDYVKKPNPKNIIPSALDKKVAAVVAEATKKASF